MRFLRSAVLAAALALAGCGTTPEERALTGASIGATSGAIFGALGGAPGLGAAIGAGVGGVVGALTPASLLNFGDPIWKSSGSTQASKARDPKVKGIQSGLTQLGYSPGPSDGVYGVKTQGRHPRVSEAQPSPDRRPRVAGAFAAYRKEQRQGLNPKYRRPRPGPSLILASEDRDAEPSARGPERADAAIGAWQSARADIALISWPFAGPLLRSCGRHSGSHNETGRGSLGARAVRRRFAGRLHARRIAGVPQSLACVQGVPVARPSRRRRRAIADRGCKRADIGGRVSEVVRRARPDRRSFGSSSTRLPGRRRAGSTASCWPGPSRTI